MTRRDSARQALLLAALLTVGVAGTPAPAGEAPDLESLRWLAGAWVHEDETGSSEELWMVPRGGIMLGLNRSVGPGGRAAFEYLRIEETEGGLVYRASPSGREPTPFVAIEVAPGRVVFENPEHDFPRRLTYRLEKNGMLRCRLEGEGDAPGTTRVLELSWRRADP